MYSIINFEIWDGISTITSLLSLSIRGVYFLKKKNNNNNKRSLSLIQFGENLNVINKPIYFNLLGSKVVWFVSWKLLIYKLNN